MTATTPPPFLDAKALARSTYAPNPNIPYPSPYNWFRMVFNPDDPAPDAVPYQCHSIPFSSPCRTTAPAAFYQCCLEAGPNNCSPPYGYYDYFGKPVPGPTGVPEGYCK